MNETNPPVTGSHGGLAEQPRPKRMNGRTLVTVKIRGVAFRASTSSRKEAVLRQMKNRDERSLDGAIMILGALVIGCLLGAATVWVLL